jgi:Uma2 family endonuclease
VPCSREQYSGARHLTHHPENALLIAEVSDSSLTQDRLTKAGIYAARGIAEYWIVAHRGDYVQVSTNPVSSERRYSTVRIARRGETITLAELPDVTVTVDDLLPPIDGGGD